MNSMLVQFSVNDIVQFLTEYIYSYIYILLSSPILSRTDTLSLHSISNVQQFIHHCSRVHILAQVTYSLHLAMSPRVYTYNPTETPHQTHTAAQGGGAKLSPEMLSSAYPDTRLHHDPRGNKVCAMVASPYNISTFGYGRRNGWMVGGKAKQEALIQP